MNAFAHVIAWTSVSSSERLRSAKFRLTVPLRNRAVFAKARKLTEDWPHELPTNRCPHLSFTQTLHAQRKALSKSSRASALFWAMPRRLGGKSLMSKANKADACDAGELADMSERW